MRARDSRPGATHVPEALYASHLRAPRDWQMGWHTHPDHHEMIVILRGGIRVAFGDGHAEVAATAGDALVYPARKAHTETATSGKPLETIFLAWSARPGDGVDGWPRNVFDSRGRIRGLAEWIVESGNLFRGDAAAARRGSLFAAILTAYREAADRETADPTYRRTDGLDAVRRYIHDHLDGPLTLADLAAQARLSPFHFTRCFRDRVGQTPMAYVRTQRIEQAKSLLLRTDEPLKVIADRVGFTDPVRLSKAFRRQMGEPPGRWRARHAVSEPQESETMRQPSAGS